MLIFKYIVGILIAWLLAIPGLIIVGIALPFVKYNKFPKYIDFFYGNSEDGVDGNKRFVWHEQYQYPAKLFPRWWWSAFRNPTNNWYRYVGIKQGLVNKIVSNKQNAHQGGPVHVRALINNHHLWFEYGELAYTGNWIPFLKGRMFRYAFGWKLWPESTKVGQRINRPIVFSILPFKRIS